MNPITDYFEERKRSNKLKNEISDRSSEFRDKLAEYQSDNHVKKQEVMQPDIVEDDDTYCKNQEYKMCDTICREKTKGLIFKVVDTDACEKCKNDQMPAVNQCKSARETNRSSLDETKEKEKKSWFFKGGTKRRKRKTKKRKSKRRVKKLH